jgi:hypothetical protein
VDAIVMHKQWAHISEAIRPLGFFTRDDLQLHISPPMPYNRNDVITLQLLCEYELPSEDEEHEEAIPMMQYHAPSIKWSGSSSRVA